MNVLEKIIKVSLCVDKSSHLEEVCMYPQQSLHLHLTVAFCNEKGTLDADAAVFLTYIGESSLESAWAKLFARMTVVPFIVSREYPDGCETPRDFVFGVPSFWRSAEGERSAGAAAGTPSLPNTQSWPCFLGGKSAEVASETTLVPAASLEEQGGSSSCRRCPASITSVFRFIYTAPDLDSVKTLCAVDGRDLSLACAMLLPLSAGLAGSCTASCDCASTPPPADQQSTVGALIAQQQGARWSRHGDAYVMRHVLARAFLPSAEWNPSAVAWGPTPLEGVDPNTNLLLGTYYLRVRLRRALACVSVAHPLSRDQVVLNLNVTNVHTSPVWLQGASFDLYTSSIVSASASGASTAAAGGADETERAVQLLAEQRPGPRSSDTRAIDTLCRVVSVTPMIVGDDRPPFTLHPDETYSFQFVLQVHPQLCYLLNPKSLEAVYQQYKREEEEEEREEVARRAMAKGGEGSGEDGGGGGVDSSASQGGGRAVVMPGCSVDRSEALLLQDRLGVAVSKEELLRVLASTFVTYVFVNFDIDKGNSAVRDLHLCHAAQWSFGIAHAPSHEM